jgi:hypothetical protein
MNQIQRPLNFKANSQSNYLQSPLGWFLDSIKIRAKGAWYAPVLIPLCVLGSIVFVVSTSIFITWLISTIEPSLSNVVPIMLALGLLGLLAGAVTGGWGGGILGAMWSLLPIVADHYFQLPLFNPLNLINFYPWSPPETTLFFSSILASISGLFAGIFWRWLSKKFMTQSIGLRLVFVQTLWMIFLSIMGLGIYVVIAGVAGYLLLAFYIFAFGPM